MEYKLIPTLRFDDVLALYQEASLDEPTNIAMGFKEIPKEVADEDLKILSDGVSLMAVDSFTNQIVAVALNGISYPGDIDVAIEELKTDHSLKFRQIYGLVCDVNRQANLFSKYQVDKIFELKMLCTSPNYRRRGIAKELFLRCIVLAEQLGFKLFKVDCSNFYTEKMAEKFGLKTESSIRFAEHRDENNEVPFKNSKPPHEFYKVMAVKLNNTLNYDNFVN